jgi:hypothetical protein
MRSSLMNRMPSKCSVAVARSRFTRTRYLVFEPRNFWNKSGGRAV